MISNEPFEVNICVMLSENQNSLMLIKNFHVVSILVAFKKENAFFSSLRFTCQYYNQLEKNLNEQQNQ